MSLCAQLRLSTRLYSSMVRKFSATPEIAHITDEPLQPFRTIESNPANHNSDHVNRFYTVPAITKDLLFRYGGLPKKFESQVETFLECCFMIRSQTVELISFLNQTDYTRPANKYVLYGEIGTGKSIAVAHLLHYATMMKKIIVHVPWVPQWFKYPKEVAVSPTKEGYYDLPLDGAAWLVHFKHQNGPLLSELNLKVSKDYEWSTRESTKIGASLIELIDLGISRVKYSCDIIYALTEELKIASTAGRCNVLVAIDGFNAFYAEKSKIKNDESKWVMPIKVSLTDAFFNITRYDWCNGAIVLTVDPIAIMADDFEKNEGLPRCLLGKEGFEHLDPFLPIKFDNYTPEEYESLMEYYRDRKWIRNMTKEGQRELELLTARNPYNVMIRSTSI